MTVEKLVLFQKIYDFLLWLYPLVNRLPKHHKTVLGRQIEETGLALLLLTASANKERGNKRLELQTQISDKLDKLRILVRLTKDLRFMSIKQYAFAAEKINEIGKILSGWMKIAPEPITAIAKERNNLPLF